MTIDDFDEQDQAVLRRLHDVRCKVDTEDELKAMTVAIAATARCLAIQYYHTGKHTQRFQRGRRK